MQYRISTYLHVCYPRWMQYEARSRFATSTRGSVLLYTTKEAQSARREIARNAPPPVIFLTYAMGNKSTKKGQSNL